MDDQHKIPKLLEFLFGEAAGAVRQGASPRLLCWCQAFDDWLAELGAGHTPSISTKAALAWRRLLQERHKLPWELGQADLEQHVAWMQAQGYAVSTIRNALNFISRFYRWCAARRVDVEVGQAFNPAAGVKRPREARYAHAQILSRLEADTLLAFLQRDPSPLGQREYAFFLARLRLGVPLRTLQQLRWGQLDLRSADVAAASAATAATAACAPQAAWVQWRPEAASVPLPAEVWHAILAWLRASGRLAGMRPETYIFVPLRSPGSDTPHDRAEAWAGERPLSARELHQNLKAYGCPAGIPEHKLTLPALQHTAARLQLEAGGGRQAPTPQAMRAFLGSQEKQLAGFKCRLGKLPPLPPDEPPALAAGQEPALPWRKPHRRQPGEGIQHGKYARSQPAQAVRAVVEEDIQGIEEQLLGLRTLGRLLFERQMQATSSNDAARLGAAYSNLASRVLEVIKAEAHLTAGEKVSPWAEEFLSVIDEMQQKLGEPPLSEEIRKQAMGCDAALGGEPELEVTARLLVEEVATVRYVLRNTYRLALEAQATDELLRLVELYGSGCIRLVRMLKAERSDGGQLDRYLRQVIPQAIHEINEEFQSPE